VNVLVNANLSGYGSYRTIINTHVSGITFSTFKHLGYQAARTAAGATTS
jgi:hypothetical protein